VTETVAVLGPGAVGGALAVRLALAGGRVLCVGRPATVAAVVREGLTLVTPDEELHARPEACERLTGPVDVLILAVKAPALDDALGRIDAAPALALSLLNGVEHPAAIRARLRRPLAVGSIGRFEAFRIGPARIAQRTAVAPVVSLAAADGLPRELERTAELLERAGLEVRTGADEKTVLWEKAARMAPLAALTAATGKTVGQLRPDPRLRAALAEACAVANADGVPTSVEEQWSTIDALPPQLTTSTARDVAAGEPSELEAIVGGVVRAGRRLGVPTPVLDELLRQCRA
jgi:2-dehydropantoate 2-reductase